MNDTKTPRTDAEATQSCDSGLRSAFVVHVEFARELEREIARLIAERDEARRMYCGRVSRDVPLDAFDIAKEMGWYCFRENAP